MSINLEAEARESNELATLASGLDVLLAYDDERTGAGEQLCKRFLLARVKRRQQATRASVDVTFLNCPLCGSAV